MLLLLNCPYFSIHYEEVPDTDPARNKNSIDDTTPVGDIGFAPAHSDQIGQSGSRSVQALPVQDCQSLNQSGFMVRPRNGSNDLPMCPHGLVKPRDTAPIAQSTEHRDIQHKNQRHCDVISARSASPGKRSDAESFTMTGHGCTMSDSDYQTSMCCAK